MLTTSRYVKLVENNDSNDLETIKMYQYKLSETEDSNVKTLIMLCNGLNSLRENIPTANL